MDFENYDIKTIIEEDTFLVWNKYEKAYYIMSIDSTKCSDEQKYFNKCESLLTKYNFNFNPRDDITLMPLDLNRVNEAVNEKVNVNSKYLVINQTTQNDLYLQYNMGFGKLAINDYRVKDFRFHRVPRKPRSDS